MEGMAKPVSRLPSKRPRESRVVRLRPANPFDLIGLIARSQNDPRKAIAELVQNSLDAGAANVSVTRWRKRREIMISVLDDGRGIFPDQTRPEALERIATNIGHSFKRNISAAERQKEMMLGKYGIGVLGFWAVGHALEMRTRVAGSDVWCLRLVRDERDAEVLRLPERELPFTGETWTEVIIRGVHEGAVRQIVGRRLGDYLGSELRGQLLERPVKLRIVDHAARGTAPKDFLVVPQKYRGRRVEELFQLSVVGHPPARLELYFADPEEERSQPATVALTCGGTVICDDVSRVENQDFAHEPWTSGVLEGFIEFPAFEVSPVTRRGIVSNPASDAFFEALRSIEAQLMQVLETEREKRRSEADIGLARELRKVFRPVARALPQYDFFDLKVKGRSASQGEEDVRLGSTTLEPASGRSDPTEVIEDGDAPDGGPEILPPGPLDSLRVVPRKVRLLPGASRKFVAKSFDAAGRRILEGVDYIWTLRDGTGQLRAEGPHAVFTATETPGSARIFVAARQWRHSVEADAIVEVVEKLAGESPDAGIPDPERVFDPAGDWRSRIQGRCWQYNAAHPDYQAVLSDPRRRFRYLVHLFTKEIVLRNYGEPKDDRLLERMVEVLTHLQTRP
jgi:hypothetical protein